MKMKLLSNKVLQTSPLHIHPPSGKIGINNKSILLWGFIFICLHAPVSAQQTLLDQPTHTKSTQQQLSSLLDQLSANGNFNFSYKTDIIESRKWVKTKQADMSLRDVLRMALGEGYSFMELNNYIIIKREQYSSSKPITNASSKKSPVSGPGSLSVNQQTMRNIIGDLLNEKLVKEIDDLNWFALDGGQFIVNGKKMNTEQHRLFREKYIGPNGDGYYYGSIPGVTGRGVFMDKSDVFPNTIDRQ